MNGRYTFSPQPHSQTRSHRNQHRAKHDHQFTNQPSTQPPPNDAETPTPTTVASRPRKRSLRDLANMHHRMERVSNFTGPRISAFRASHFSIGTSPSPRACTAFPPAPSLRARGSGFVPLLPLYQCRRYSPWSGQATRAGAQAGSSPHGPPLRVACPRDSLRRRWERGGGSGAGAAWYTFFSSLRSVGLAGWSVCPLEQSDAACALLTYVPTLRSRSIAWSI